jgi:hypothetical protein
MAVATMSAYPNASGSLAPMGVFVPSTPMVVKREKRRRRRNPDGDAAADKVRAKRCVSLLENPFSLVNA